ncbi:MAG: hypothetical protein COB85_00655 [Bacteroidetes bacterium]|nr:MAG: hypothetical protein COB85_00655 [Bacteroidota bacterium]
MSWIKVSANCLLCGENNFKMLGVRGTREYTGADPSGEPHITTNVVRCRNCDFVYINPEIKGVEQFEREYYNNPDNYHAVNDGDASKLYSKRLKLISKFKKSGNLLDVGSGKGEFLNVAIKAGWSASGIEPSQAFCEYAEQTYKVSTVQGYIDEIKTIPRFDFDVITLHHVLEHMHSPAAQLLAISNYLKPDGILFIEVPNVNSYFLRVIDLFFRLKGLNWSSRLSPLHPPYHKFGYNKKSLMFLLNRCNYETLVVTTLSGRERGHKTYSDKSFNLVSLLRDLTSSILNLVGNGEMLCIIAKKKS